LTAYREIGDIPAAVELAVITVPAPLVPETLLGCARKGVKAAILISAGFAETGESGRGLQEVVTRIARETGMRVMGPNCMGLWSAEAKLNLCFGVLPRSGPISFISQSGTFGIFLAEEAAAKGYGLSKFVSIGNQADLEVTDYLEYLAQDPETRVIVCYMEGFKDGRRFFELARRLVRSKPIVIFKAGRTEAGTRASLSHTASLAGSDSVFDHLCRQAGLLRAQEALHSFEMAEALAEQPPAPGKRIAILGSGGQGVVTADACNLLGLEVPCRNPATVAEIARVPPAHAPRPTNPVDFAGSARTAMQEARVVETLLQQDYIDGVITNLPINPLTWSYLKTPGRIPPEMMQLTLQAIEGTEYFSCLAQKYGKPVVTQRFFRMNYDIVVDIVRGHDDPQRRKLRQVVGF